MCDSLSSATVQAATESQAGIPSCAVVVMSCDAYRDLWKPFFTLFWRYWPDCPFPIYFGTNAGSYEDSRVVTVALGDYEWSKRFRLCLEQIEADYVLLLLEDYFLDEPISNERFTRYLKMLRDLGGTVLRLYPRPGPDIEIPGHPELGRIHRKAPYRISAQPAIWRRIDLLDLLRDEESIWDFEWKGTTRSRTKTASFYSTYKTEFPYRHVLERGQWFRSAAHYYRAQQIGCDFTARRVMSPLTSLKKAINGRRKNWMQAMAAAIRRWRI